MKHQARKRFGQNFLQDQSVIAEIVNAVHPTGEYRLVEIGPGLGALTEPVLHQAGKLDVVELDRDLASRFVRKETQVINKLDVDSPQQINLRVRVAEISRSTFKELGVNWEVLASTGNFVFALATGTPTVLGGLPSFFPVGPIASPGGASNTINTPGAGSNTAFMNFNNGSVDVNTLIDALEVEGLVKEPLRVGLRPEVSRAGREEHVEEAKVHGEVLP